MNTRYYFGVIAPLLFLSLVSCSGTIVIDNPEIMATDTRQFEIEKIELSDTATILHLDTYGSSGYRVRIASDTYIEGNFTGKQYKLIRSTGLDLNEGELIPESGNVKFQLLFEPLNKKETAVEFVINPNNRKFTISGIQLKEKSVKGKIKCRINGDIIDRPQSSRLILMPWKSDIRVYPWLSVPVRDGKFDYTFYTDIEEVYVLVFYDEYINGAYRSVDFFAENGEITFTLNSIKKWNENNVSTKAPLNVLSMQYEEEIKKIISEYNHSAIDEEMGKLREEDRYHSDEYKKITEALRGASDDKRDSLFGLRDELQKSGRAYSDEGKVLNEKYKKLTDEVYAKVLNFIKTNPALPAYFVLVSHADQALSLMRHDPDIAPDVAPFFAVFKEVFRNKYPNHPYTWKMETYITGSSLKEGGRYIDFTAPDVKGKEFKLSEQIAGKVALIDLWASWCGPCRRASISMIPVYEKFKDKGFTIIGVAREKNVADMVRAAEQDGYPWLLLVELNDRGKIWQKYGIGNSGGSTFLVDKTGIILSVNPTAEQVAAILEKQFN